MTIEEGIGQLKFMLEQMPEEPPLECDYIDEWLDTDRKIRSAFEMAIKALEQKPYEDCISRQAVLEYIEASDAELGHSSENELVCQDIKELPPVTLQSKTEQWIPVSEKPKEEGSYMTTLDYGEYGLVAGQRYYHGEDYGWSDVCVIAWMPLPKPYKPQESEGV